MLELYHNNISVCAQKVRIVLAEKDVPWTSHHLKSRQGRASDAAIQSDEPAWGGSGARA